MFLIIVYLQSTMARRKDQLCNITHASRGSFLSVTHFVNSMGTGWPAAMSRPKAVYRNS